MTLTGEPFLYNLMLSQFCKCDSRTRFRSDSDDKDDPHKALGNIVLDDFLDPLPTKVQIMK